MMVTKQRVLIFLINFLISVNAYTYMQPQHFGMGECLDDEWQVHPVGATWYDKDRCEKIACVFYDDILYTEGYGCSTIGHPDGCWLTPGRGENYPYCCPRVECPGGIIW
ncbi:U-scoloptoxin(16)-Er12a isoform X2 [Parasteatoda tepidariorum]|uniref:U-scoloptoxin(16)-Er12a isoform X1 n=1 Tax=Parasteatoda tepidariorum TaxID=114398 RepID=UPI00077FAC86|nr:U-scoloptoxin(16)-Er12a [Parasteatoda tepidariorum]